MKTYQVTLPDEFAEFVDRMIAEKKWDSVDDLVTYAISQTQAELSMDEFEDNEAFRKAIQSGIDQLERGDRLVGPLVLRRLRVKLEAARGEDAPHDMNSIWRK